MNQHNDVENYCTHQSLYKLNCLGTQTFFALLLFDVKFLHRRGQSKTKAELRSESQIFCLFSSHDSSVCFFTVRQCSEEIVYLRFMAV